MMPIPSPSRPRGVVFAAALLAAVLLAVAARPADAQDRPIAPDVKRYLKQFVDELRALRIGRDDIDWGEVESKTLAAAAGAQSVSEAYPAIRTALVEIRDPWATYRSATGQAVGPDPFRCMRGAATTPTVPADVGYLKLTPIANRGIRAEREAALAVRNASKAVEEKGAVHWIIDLRGYFMGSLPSAVIGASPLMGDGTVFKMRYANSVVPFDANESSIKSNGEELQMSLGKYRLRNARRIAVLVDGGTAGVGELLAIAIMGRDDTRVFGTPTCGIPPLKLVPQKLEDGAEFTLSAFLVQDRYGKLFRGPIAPHEPFADESQLFPRVLGWLAAGK